MLDLVNVQADLRIHPTTALGAWRRDPSIHIQVSSDRIETAFMIENGQVTRRYAAGKAAVDENYHEIEP